MVRRIVVVTLCCLTLNLFGQEFADKDYYLIDSLDLSKLADSEKQLVKSSLKLFHEAKTDTAKLSAISIIIEQSWDDNLWPRYNDWAYDFVLAKLKTEKDVKTRFKLKIEEGKAINNFGFIKMMDGDFDAAKKDYEKSLAISKQLEHKKGIAVGLNNIGGVYEVKGEIEKALDLYLESLILLRELNDSVLMGATINNIGIIYDNLNQLETAIGYYQESIAIQERHEDWQGVSTTINNLGTIYLKQKNYDKALTCFKRSVELLEELQGDEQGLAASLVNIGEIYYYAEDYNKALSHYSRALEIQKKIGDKIGIAKSYLNLGKTNYQMGNKSAGLEMLNQSLELSKELGYPIFIRDAAMKYSQFSEWERDYKKALELYKVYIAMRDSINNENLQEATIKQHAKFEYEKQKALDDAEHDKLLAIEQEEKEKQQIITYATAGGLGLVGVFLIIVFNRLKVTRRQKNIIEKQKIEVEHQKEEIEVAHQELEEKNKEITDSIQYAKRIQSAILPPDKLVKEYLDQSFVLYKPKDIVAGDFYWMEHKEGKVLFAAADCTGHGVPGAMVSVVCNNGLNRSVREHGLTDPGQILDKTREIVVQEFEKSEDEVKDGMDIAICVLEGRQLEYAGAHNPLWIIRKDATEIEEIKGDKQPIGQYDANKPFTSHKITLNEGDSFYVFSDGFADQFGGEKGKKLKTTNFKKLLISVKDKSMGDQKKAIDKAFEDWKGDLEQLDDVCVIGVRV